MSRSGNDSPTGSIGDCFASSGDEQPVVSLIADPSASPSPVQACKPAKPVKRAKPVKPAKPAEPVEPVESGGEVESRDEDKGFIDDNDEYNYEDMQTMLETAHNWLTTNMADNETRPYPGKHVTTELLEKGKTKSLRLAYWPPQPEIETVEPVDPVDPVEAVEAVEAVEPVSKPPTKKARKGKKARKSQSVVDSGFTATLSVVAMGRSHKNPSKTPGEWVILARVTPVDSLRHMIQEVDIESIKQQAQIRKAQHNNAGKVEGRRKRQAPVLHSIRLVLPHYVHGEVRRYIYPATLLGGKVSGKPYLDVKFPFGKDLALIGFLSRLALPDSPVHETIVEPDDTLTAHDSGSEDSSGEDNDVQEDPTVYFEVAGDGSAAGSTEDGMPPQASSRSSSSSSFVISEPDSE